MEDRYLFRGKCIDNGEWMSGSYYEFIGKSYILKPPFASKNSVYVVDPSTICQCTGLKDKSGRRIFENDIVKDNVIYGVVKWDNANAMYIIDDRDDGYQVYSDWWHEIEVIGNQFDNPELLEV